MKKILTLLAGLTAIAMVACKPEGGNNASSDSISVAPEKITAVPYTGETYTVTVKASGNFSAKPNVDWITVDGTSIIVAASEVSEARNGEVVFTCGTATAKVTVSQEAAPKPVEYTPLTSGPANCYIIDEAGNYSFDATTIGNGASGILSTFTSAYFTSAKIDPKGVKLVWEEAEGLITNLKLQDGKLCFSCAQKDGNAVVAATDADGKVLWSWHIWSAEAPNDVKCTETITFMDRNLGATSADITKTESYGLYYQWGRKDPFSSILAFDSANGEGKYHPVVGNYPEGGEDNSMDETIHSVAYSVAHPDEYIGDYGDGHQNWVKETDNWLWGAQGHGDAIAQKTIFDPCPDGYMMPASGYFWHGINDDGATAGKVLEGGAMSLFSGKIMVPSAGFIYVSGYGWYDANGAGWGGLWAGNSAGWGDTSQGFRLSSGPSFDPTSYNGTAAAHPVRCAKI